MPSPETSFRQTLVRVFECDPSLLEGVDPKLAERLRRHVMARVITVPAGRPVTLSPDERRDVLGLLVLDGLLICSVSLGGHRGVSLYGTCDFVRPWSRETVMHSIPSEMSWKAMTPAWLAVLDSEFEQIASRCPGVLSRLVDRLEQPGSLAMSRALSQIPHLEKRLQILMWQLADRWGRVEPEGVAIHMDLNQSVLADLVGACRQSVNRTLAALTRRGLLARRGRIWILTGSPPQDLHLSSYASAEAAVVGSA
jgi:CRP/FNR family transcriptional regulator, cyclic AMP receptor protein